MFAPDSLSLASATSQRIQELPFSNTWIREKAVGKISLDRLAAFPLRHRF
jgi:hypothetical protein